jgi:hypothetical protein
LEELEEKLAEQEAAGSAERASEETGGDERE